jgi:hypothetical protein
MNELSPSQAAAIASGVYLLVDRSVQSLQARGEPLGCEGLFHADGRSGFQGRSGNLAWHALSGFGYIAAGEGSFAGDVLIATRGTLTTTDWLSNANIGLQLGPSGLPVHAGFHEIWKTFKPSLETFLRGRNPTRIHCVGHSLGGALATITADMISAGRIADVMLYSFGCPRTGDGIFSRALTQRVGRGQIHRVFHPSDPVPMIPLFPFWHAPVGQHGLAISNAKGGLINSSAHSMRESYIPALGGSSWLSLAGAAAQRADEAQQAQGWLERSAQGQSGFVMGSAKLLDMIGRALRWLMLSAAKVAGHSVGAALSVGATVLDQVAWVLSTGASLSMQVAGYVKTLIGAIFSFLGRSAIGVGDVTVAFLRWVLALLYTSVRAAAQGALARLR